MRVILEGNIGSGKTTLTEALRAAYPEALIHPEDVHDWRDLLELFYADPAAWALPLSLRVLLSHHVFRVVPREALYILERCPLSCRHVFTQLLFNDGTMPQHHWDLFRQFADELGWEPAADDVILYIDTPVDVCLDRITARGRRGEEHIDVHYLRRLEFQYNNMLKYCACPVERLDGTKAPHILAADAVSAIRRLTETPTRTPS